MSNWNDCYASGKDFMMIHPNLMKMAIKDLDGLEHKHALDFGCGTGRNAQTLKELGFGSVTGIDASEEAIKLAQKRRPDIEFSTGDENDLPGTATYDLVLVSLVYPFIEDKQKFVSALHTCIKSGGIAVFYNPLESSKNIAIDEAQLTASLRGAGFRGVTNVNTSYCGTDVLSLLTAENSEPSRQA